MRPTNRQLHCLHYMGIPYWRLRTAYTEDKQLYVNHPRANIQLVWTRLPQSPVEQRVTDDLTLILANSMPDWRLTSAQQAQGLVLMGTTTTNKLAVSAQGSDGLNQFRNGQWYTVIPEPETMENDQQLKPQAWSQITELIKVCNNSS